MRAGSPTQRKGRVIEDLAQDYLRKQGLTPQLQSFHCRLGEIDLVMQDLREEEYPQLVFVEVRYRRNDRFGGPAATVTRAKQQRLMRAAQVCMQRYRISMETRMRFDVVAITGPPQERQIRWIQNAFEG